MLGELPWSSLHQVIVVDNGSQDCTAEVASAHGALVVREPQRGYGAACLAGVGAAPGADILIFLDADSSFDAQEIPLLIGPIERGEAELVLGSRLAGTREPGAMPLHGVSATGWWQWPSAISPSIRSLISGRFGHQAATCSACGWKNAPMAGPVR